MKLDLACRVEKGIRETNDDRAMIVGCILDQQTLAGESDLPAMAVVCDGCGGYAGGGIAAETVLTTLSEFTADTLSDPEILSRALDSARAAVDNRKSLEPELGGMCTTIAGCLFTEESTLIFHAGDSRVYRYDGISLAPMTVDHSLVQRMVDAGQFTEEEAMASPQRNVITRCIGADCPPPEIYLSHAPIAPGEIYLLCSDGLWEYLSKEEIASCLSSGKPLREIADNMTARALEADGDDNITVCLCACPGSSLPRESEPFFLD